MERFTLAVNAGSSSLKCRLFENIGEGKSRDIREVAVIQVSGLNSDKVDFSFDPEPETPLETKNISTHEEAFAHLLKQLREDSKALNLDDLEKLVIAHRVVHGGENEKEVVINQETFHQLQKLESLAPLYDQSFVNPRYRH
jgi:acetate kinase